MNAIERTHLVTDSAVAEPADTVLSRRSLLGTGVVGAGVLGAALFVAGVAATYALWILCAAASFWVVRLDNLMYLLGSVFDVARWPVDLFPAAWRVVFTFVIPVAVITTFPARALLGTLSPTAALATLAGAAGLVVVSRVVWRTAIRSYTSASS